MVRFPDADAVYTTADLFRNRCLVEGRSFLWPDQSIWTQDNLRRLWELTSSETTIPNLVETLNSEPVALRMIATDVMAAGTIFPAVKRTTQERNIRELLDRFDLPGTDRETWNQLSSTWEIAVPASFTHYPGQKIQNFLTWLLGLRVMVEQRLANAGRDTIIREIESASAEYKDFWATLFWGMLHAMYPDQIAAMPGKEDRLLVLRAFSSILGDRDFPNDFAALDYLRKTLPQPKNGELFDFYEPSLVDKWGLPKHRKRIAGLEGMGSNGTTQKIDDPNGTTSPGAEPVYEAARLFLERCIESDLSFLWPAMPLWTQQNLDALWNTIERRLLVDQPHKKETLGEALKGASTDLVRMAADLVAFARLYPSLDPENVRQAIEDILNIGAIDSPSTDEMGAVWTGLRGRAPGGKNYHPGTIFADIAYFLRFVQEAKSDSVDLSDVEAFREHADAILYDPALSHNGRRVWTLPRHTILHLFYPDSFVGVVNKQHRAWILNRFSNDVGVPSGIDEDMALQHIRSHLQNQHLIEPFDFYDDAVKPLWFRGTSSHSLNEVARKAEEGDGRSNVESFHQVLIDITHLPADFLQEIDKLLQKKRQLIFEGPPGSGKTFVAEKFARWFTGQSVDDTTLLDEHVEIVQFHQSYGYEDFVQGIRPITRDGTLAYEVRDGIFLDMVARARANPGERFVLIIDEINRGNLSRIFGELLLLLEYRNQSVRLPYGSGDAAYLSIPENLYIIGTMNTADRSLAQIDYALRRRFYFVRFMPVENGRAGVFEQWLEKHVAVPEDRERLASLFRNLNDGIRQHLATDDLQVGHSYFMQEGIETKVVFDRVWKRAVRPLLEEYVHHHRNREQILEALDPDTLMRVRIEEEDMVLASTPDEE